MKTSSIILIAALLGALLAPDFAFAADTSTETPNPGQPFLHPSDDVSYSKDIRDDERLAKAKPSDNGKVLYISGGVADSGMRAIDAEEKAYNLKILFTAGREYLADVGVRIVDSKDNEVLSTTTQGPVLLVRMPPGSYVVETKALRGSLLDRHVNVEDDHLAFYVLRYPAIEE
jgi:hypothetical protein